MSGHHRKADGSVVVTSNICGTKGDCVVTLSGSVYELGEVDPEYEAAYPNARQRLVETWARVREEGGARDG